MKHTGICRHFAVCPLRSQLTLLIAGCIQYALLRQYASASWPEKYQHPCVHLWLGSSAVWVRVEHRDSPIQLKRAPKGPPIPIPQMSKQAARLLHGASNATAVDDSIHDGVGTTWLRCLVLAVFQETRQHVSSRVTFIERKVD